MSHQNTGDPNAHYSVQGETSAGSKVRGGHAAEAASQQTVRCLSLPRPDQTHMQLTLPNSKLSELVPCGIERYC